MTTDGTDLERLRALAEAATPGPCERNDNQDYAEVTRANVMQAMVATEADASFLAAIDPQTIIALITRCLAAEKERDEARAANIAAVGLANKYQALNSVPDAVAVIERVCVERDAEKVRAQAAESALAQAIAERDGERDARERCSDALREKDKAMGVLFERLSKAGVDCSDLIS